MVVGVAVDPTVFGPAVIRDRQTRDQAVGLLRGVLANGIILSGNKRAFVRGISEAVSGLSAGLGKQIEICVTELLQQKKRYLATPKRGGEADRDILSDVVRVATDLRADVIVCADVDGIAGGDALADAKIEVVELKDYSECLTERRRRHYLSAARLDGGGEGDEQDGYIGRAVKYARRVSVVDRYFGLHAMQGGARLGEYVRGAAYVARQWSRHSPYASGSRLELEVITVGGRANGRGEYMDPTKITTVLTKALRVADGEGVVGEITVTVKQDRRPRLVRDRFLVAKRRCWGIRHGIDSLGGLEDVNKEGATFIDPASQSYMDLVSEMRNLADAE